MKFRQVSSISSSLFLAACGGVAVLFPNDPHATTTNNNNNVLFVNAFSSVQSPSVVPRTKQKAAAAAISNRGSVTRLHDIPPTETFTDVQEAVENILNGMDRYGDYDSATDAAINDAVSKEDDDVDDDDDVVQVRNEIPVDVTTKKELLKDLQGILQRIEHMEQSRKGASLLNDINNKLSFLPRGSHVSADEAAISASLYMNPNTKKIAEHVKITWEPQVAEMLHNMEQMSNPNRPFMVGIVGIPGSGKSTSAEVIQAILGEDRAIVMPHDGYHIPLAELAEMPNAADAIYRRGAPDTFNPKALKEALTRIAGYHNNDDDDDCSHVCMPGFDHSVGDPTPDQHTFQRDCHKIVMCEGLYLLHDDHGWEDIKSFFDWTIYIDADVDACIERLKERNKCIPGYTPEEIEIRCDEVDRVNAITAREGAYKYASQIVKSGASSEASS